MLVLLVAVLVELGAAVAWSIGNGRLFTPQRARARCEQVAGDEGRTPAAPGSADDAAQRAAAHAVVQHPYLGYVHAPPAQPDPALPISRFGLHGAQPPLPRRSADRFVVAVLGGSVALHFGLYAEQSFAAALGRSPALAGRRVELHNLALGGYKQPQQLLMLQLLVALGAEFDCVLCLDGFNEVALVDENVPLGVPAWFPRSWARLLDASPTPEQLSRIGLLTLLGERRREAARDAAAWSWSPLRQMLWWWSDRRRAEEIAELRAAVERARPTDNPAITGPGTDGLDLVAARAQNVELWQRCSHQLHALCTSTGALFLHFLQPNQYVPGAKPIGAAEAAVAIDPEHRWRAAVLHGYPLLRAAGQRLREQGVAFTDLTGVFADHPEPLYTDTCCHLGRAGNELLAAHLAAAVRARIDLQGAALRSLRVVPDELQLESPLLLRPVQLFGVDDQGRELDLSGAGFGVTVTCEPPGAVEVAADGAVRAVRRGAATVRFVRAGLAAELTVRGDWPDLLAADDGRASGDRPRPSLRAVLDGDALALVVHDLPPELPRLLVTGTRPLPESPIGVDPFGLQLTPLVGEQSTLRLKIPRGPADRPLFVRCYALEPTGSAIAAASNTVVLTPAGQ